MNYSLQKLLVILGLVIIPFYEIIIKVLPFVKNVAMDTRAPKEIIAMIFALSIGLLAVFQGTVKPFRNKWLLAIPVYLLFNLIISPHVDMFINNVDSGDFYFWKPFAEILCFALMVVSVASMNIDFKSVLYVMVVCSTVMAGYVIMQSLGFDQFWIARVEQSFTAVPSSSLGGNLGQPTLVSGFIVMIIPLAFYFKKYWMAALMIVAALLTRSQMAILAIIMMSVVSAIYFNKIFIPIIFLLFICLVGIGIFYSHHINLRGKISEAMSGRTEVWQNIYTDIRDGAIEGSKQDFSATGVGLGRFAFIFPQRHKSEFQQAHNDFLEFAYNCGLVGLVLLMVGLYFIFKSVLVNISPMSFSILLSFVTILFIGLGSFPFQLGVQQFYSAVLVGLLNNRGVLNET